MKCHRMTAGIRDLSGFTTMPVLSSCASQSRCRGWLPVITASLLRWRRHCHNSGQPVRVNIVTGEYVTNTPLLASVTGDITGGDYYYGEDGYQFTAEATRVII